MQYNLLSLALWKYISSILVSVALFHLSNDHEVDLSREGLRERERERILHFFGFCASVSRTPEGARLSSTKLPRGVFCSLPCPTCCSMSECTAYSSADGAFVDGFSCPRPGNGATAIYCCGFNDVKYCCDDPNSFFPYEYGYMWWLRYGQFTLFLNVCAITYSNHINPCPKHV